MNYYSFHIGDYRGATAHLSNEEDLAYRRLLDMCYDTESAIPLETGGGNGTAGASCFQPARKTQRVPRWNRLPSQFKPSGHRRLRQPITRNQ